MDKGTARIENRTQDPRLLSWILVLGILTTLIALALYGYLGTFSRYGSDDYCLSAFFHQQQDFVSMMVDRYMNSSSRYTNILFIGLVDKLFGWYNVAVLPPLMLALFVLGTYLFLLEIARFASLRWSRWLILLLAALVVYFSVMQAPNLYETLYWRAGMTSHFAPLVFVSYLGAFLVRELRLAADRSPAIWKLFVCFLSALVIGGFSEPPLTALITTLVLGIMAVWLWDRGTVRRARLSLLFSTLFGAFLALLILALAPANSIRLGTAPPGLVELVFRTFKYPLEFITDVFRSLPLSTLINFLLPAVLFYAYYSSHSQELTVYKPKWLIVSIIAVSLLSYLLIAASFAPSVYGQSFPVARARFTGRVVLTCALMMNGALIGILAAQITTKRTSSTFLYFAGLVGLVLLSLYPLRTASRLLSDVSVYQQRAAAWDARDAKIRELKASGERDIWIPFLSKEVTQDLGDHKGFRLNECASTLYGVNSILVVPPDGN